MASTSVDHQSAGWDFDDQVGAVAAVAIGASPALSVLGFPLPALGERGQAVDARRGDDDHVAAVPSVAAVGPAARHVLLASEAHAAVTAAPALDLNGDR